MVALNSKVLRLAVTNLHRILSELIYLKFGIDFTRPVQIYGIVNRHCNLRCKMCNCWRTENTELPASVWIHALKSLKEFVGTFNINFSGGEPLLKKDLFEILEFCGKENIIAGITTNGLLLNKEKVKRIIDCGLFNVNISIDSLDDKIYDKIRGVPGYLSRVKENVNYLKDYKEKAGSDLKIIVKPTVCSENLHCLNEIVEYAKETGITGVNFQPIFKWSEESNEMFKVDFETLDKTVEQLIEMKNEGYPILNSEANIRQWVDHFKCNIPQRHSPCRVALRNITIKATGDIVLCGFIDSLIGNIQNDDIGTIWYSQETKKLKTALVGCKRLCTATCVVKRNWRDYIDLFSRFMR